jgi:hypothetical protein
VSTIPAADVADLASLRVNSGGNPIVAWQDSASGRYEVYLRAWNGSAWAELASSASGTGLSASSQVARYPSLALESGGNPVVAWSDSGTGNPEIYLKRWTGTSWAEVGGSATVGGVSNKGAGVASSQQCSLALDGSNSPAIAWQAAVGPLGTFTLYFKRWNGSSWGELGGSATGSGVASPIVAAAPSLAVNTSGNPVIAWQDAGGGGIFLKLWNGSAWVELGGSATGGGISGALATASTVSLALDVSGNPTVAWQDGSSGKLQVYLKKWNGSSWVALGGSATTGGVSATTAVAQSPSLALDTSGNPYVTWSDSASGNLEIYLRYWNGSSWLELGGSATSGGVSSTVGASTNPSLGLDSSGNPSLAWTDTSSGKAEIYARRWNGASWVELAGSGSGSGLSQ